MRTLNQQEMQQVSGGTLCLLPALIAKLGACLSKLHAPKCEPKPKCDPKPKCEPAPKTC